MKPETAAKPETSVTPAEAAPEPASDPNLEKKVKKAEDDIVQVVMIILDTKILTPLCILHSFRTCLVSSSNRHEYLRHKSRQAIYGRQ